MPFRERRLRPPARSLGVLHPRRGVPDPGAGGEGGAARDARRDADRPRLAGGRDRPLQSRAGAGREAHHRLRGLRRRTTGPSSTKGHGAPTLLAGSNAGYANLIKLCSLGYLEGYYYRPRVDWELLERYAPGLIVPLGLPVRPGLEGDRRVAAERRRAGARSARADLRPRQHLRRVAERRPLDIQQPVFQALPGLAAKRGLAARRHSVTSTTSTPQMRTRTRRCSASSQATRSRTPTTGSSARTSSTSSHLQEMALDFPGPRGRDAPDARDRRPLQRRDRARSHPAPLVPDARTAARRSTTSSSSATSACEKRYDTVTPELTERLQFELKTIREMGFADYFLIVADFIGFAKRDGVVVGPGRGSGRGLARRLLRSRSRTSTRSATTCCSSGSSTRWKVDARHRHRLCRRGPRARDQLRGRKYGRDHVAQIITFSTMAARAALRDAGRVLEIPYGTVDRIAKLVPEGPGQTLAEAMYRKSSSGQAVATDPVAKEIVELAQPLEGLTRADSIHAAGVVIGAKPLTRTIPLQQKGPDAGGRDAVLDEHRRGARPAQDGLPRVAQPRRDQDRPSS